MKTTNNVQKAILKSVAVVISLVLISFTVSAQDFWKTLLENETINEFALAMADNNPAPAEAESNVAFMATLETETEEPLEMESWMTNENSFGTFITIEREMENPMELENWMTNENNFDANFFHIETEAEESIELKDWMFNENNFESDFQQEKEEILQLESWMVENNYWEIG